MRKQRTFQPTADQLESRKVLSQVGLTARGFQAAFHPTLQLNTPFAHSFRQAAIGNATATATFTLTAPAISNFNFGQNALFSGRLSPLGGSNLGSGINNGFFTTFNNPNFGINTTGVSNGLAFNSGLGLPGNLGSTLFNNGATTGLAFNNGLGLPSNAGFGFVNSTGSTGLNFNNGLGTPGGRFVNGAATGLNFNNGLGSFGTFGSTTNPFGSPLGITGTNPFATNAFATNPFATNGFATNGFATNGFGTNGFFANNGLFGMNGLFANNGFGVTAI